MKSSNSKVSYKHNSNNHRPREESSSGNSRESIESRGERNGYGEKLTKKKAAKDSNEIKFSSHSSTSTAASKHIRDDAPLAKSTVQRAVRDPIYPTLRSIDTMEMDAPLDEHQIEGAITRLKLMVIDRRARRITKESGFWKATFSVPLGSGKHSDRNVSLTLYFVCLAKNADVPMRIQFNVGLIRDDHVKHLIQVFKEVFPLDYKQVARSLRVHGVDEAYDREGSLEDFVLERASSTTVERYYIKTNTGGNIQTSYIGSVDSPSHGVLYALGSADAYRNARGQAVPLNADTATHTFKCRDNMIRIESRRVFKQAPLTLAQVIELPSAFHEYQFFDLTRLPAKERNDPLFMGYVDSVRLRGLHGASKRMVTVLGGGRPATRRIAEFEQRLGKASCTWWSAIDHRQQLGVLLRDAPIWRFLRLTAKPS
jgi:hypothetical protein